MTGLGIAWSAIFGRGVMMPAPYSVDLHWRIVHACERGIQSQREVAELFLVSQATVENIWRLYRRTGDVTPQRLHRMGAPVRVDEKAREQVLAPTLKPGDVLIMDNLSAHKVPGVEAAITARGAGRTDLSAAVLSGLLAH
jgi:hypothetical protein